MNVEPRINTVRDFCWECSAPYGDYHRSWCSTLKQPKPVATVLGMSVYVDKSLPDNVIQIGNQRFEVRNGTKNR